MALISISGSELFSIKHAEPANIERACKYCIINKMAMFPGKFPITESHNCYPVFYTCFTVATLATRILNEGGFIDPSFKIVHVQRKAANWDSLMAEYCEGNGQNAHFAKICVVARTNHNVEDILLKIVSFIRSI